MTNIETTTVVTKVNTTQNLATNIIETIGTNTSVVKEGTLTLCMVSQGTSPSQGLTIEGSVPTYTQLPSNAGQNTIWVTVDDNQMYFRKGTEWIPIGTTGVKGERGSDGKDGQIRYTGTGVPGVIIGATAGDTYLDMLTGNIYTLV